jgi:hypothetical protein
MVFHRTAVLIAGAAGAFLIALGGCGGSSGSSRSADLQKVDCSKVNKTLDGVFDGNYAELPPAKNTNDLINNFLGSNLDSSGNPTNAMTNITTHNQASNPLKAAEKNLYNTETGMANSNDWSQAQVRELWSSLDAIKRMCGPASWTKSPVRQKAVLCPSCGHSASNGPSPSPTSESSTPAASSSPKQPSTVTYVVTGTAGASVTYGPAGSDLQGSVPMSVSAPLKHPAYYAISAQLNGSGQVSCAIDINGRTISSASATGGYNIASCEIDQNPITGQWENTNGG